MAFSKNLWIKLKILFAAAAAAAAVAAAAAAAAVAATAASFCYRQLDCLFST